MTSPPTSGHHLSKFLKRLKMPYPTALSRISPKRFKQTVAEYIVSVLNLVLRLAVMLNRVQLMILFDLISSTEQGIFNTRNPYWLRVVQGC